MISIFYVIFSINILVNGGELFDNTLQYLQLMYEWNEPFYIHTPCCSEGWLSTGKQANQDGALFVEESSTSPPKAVLYVNDIDVNNSPYPTISFYWDNAGTRTYLCRSWNTAHWSIIFGTSHIIGTTPDCVFRIRESDSVIPVLGSSIEMKGIELFCGTAPVRNVVNPDERYATCQGTAKGASEIYFVPVNKYLTSTGPPFSKPINQLSTGDEVVIRSATDNTYLCGSGRSGVGSTRLRSAFDSNECTYAVTTINNNDYQFVKISNGRKLGAKTGSPNTKKVQIKDEIFETQYWRMEGTADSYGNSKIKNMAGWTNAQCLISNGGGTNAQYVKKCADTTEKWYFEIIGSASRIIPNISPNISPNINTLYTLELEWVMPIIGVVLILLLSMGMYLTYYSFTVRRNNYDFIEPQASK